MTNETTVSLDKYQYDGNTVMATPDFSFSEVATLAGYPDANTETRWDAIARMNGFDGWMVFKAALMSGERVVVGKYDDTKTAPTTPVMPVTNSNVTYSRLEEPLLLAINKTTHGWYISDHTQDTVTLTEGQQFTAYGKAVDQNTNTTYFMSKEDFGNAEVTGVPAINFGIATIDLSPISIPASPIAPSNDNEPEATQDSKPNESKAVSVPVRIVPPDPLKWQKSYVTEVSNYVSNGNYIIHDIAGQLDDKIITKGMKVPIAGRFEKDGVKYYRTATSAAAGTWYGIPVDTLQPDGFSSEDELDDYLSSLSDNAEPISDTLIKSGATARGLLDKFTDKFKLKRK